ncbi:hypothetical protein [Paracoccus marcusii]|uniref:hypothetical protein n=1 Tax=Paracoccus marcusii TaxID=59779 RepID=UPI003736FDA4
MGLLQSLGIETNPFEHLAAETEPQIAEYAVRPPYLNTIADRAKAIRPYMLFGDRGSGKSATRITVYNQLWSAVAKKDGTNAPLAVNLSDFTRLMDAFSANKLTDYKIISLAAYFTIEQILSWLASLEEEERSIFLEGLDTDEKANAIALTEAF